jgi:hypothetical protein
MSARFSQASGILVVGAQVRIHVRPVLPGFRDHHQHGFRQLAAGQRQELEGVVEARRVARAVSHDRIDLLEVVAEQRGGHGAFASVHPVLVAANGVDLAVVRHHPEGVGEIPGAEGVRAVARVHERQRRMKGRIRDVREELPDLLGDQHADVGDGARGEARHVEERVELSSHQLLHLAPNDVEAALEGVAVFGLRALSRHEDLPNRGQARTGQPTDRRRIVRHVAPAQHPLALGRDDLLEDRLLAGGRGAIRRQEHHAHRVAPGRGELDPETGAHATEEAIRNLDQQAGPIPGIGVAAAGAAVAQVDQDLDALLDDVVLGLPVHPRHEADAAGVMLESRVIQPLLSRRVGEVHASVRSQTGASRPRPDYAPKSLERGWESHGSPRDS